MRITGSRCLAGVQLLLIDDDDDLRHELRSILAFHGACVEECDGAAAARARLARRRFDVIVSDIEMPDEDGCALVQSLRSSPDARLRELPAAAISARDDVVARRRALDAGFDRFVSKMSSVGVMIRALEELTHR